MTTAECLDHQVLNQTESLCAICKRGVQAEIYERNSRIYLRKTCPEHGEKHVLISSDAGWYHSVMKYPAELKAPAIVMKEVEDGCPFDCGACSAHEQTVYLPVIPITSACNLDCPICYTINKNENAYHISLEEFSQILEVMRKSDPDRKIINLTGGEPTLHPQFLEIIELCHNAGIHRITVSTHGLSLIRNEELLEKLAELRARIVLSFDSFDDDINEKMLGARLLKQKMKVLDQFERYKIDTTLIPVIALGVNDHEIGDFIQLMTSRDSIRSLEIHSMTFTGQGGVDFDPDSRITTPDILQRIEKATEHHIRMSDFVPSPCAHPLCYQTCYLLDLGGKRFTPFPTTRTRLPQNFSAPCHSDPPTAVRSLLSLDKPSITGIWGKSNIPVATITA